MKIENHALELRNITVKPKQIPSQQTGEYKNYIPFGPNLVQWQNFMSVYLGRHMVGVGIPTNAVVIGPEKTQQVNNQEWNSAGVYRRAFFIALPTKTNQYFNLKEQQMIPSQPSDSIKSRLKFDSMIIALNAAVAKL